MLQVRDFVEARLYRDDQAVVQAVLRHLLRRYLLRRYLLRRYLLRGRPNLRVLLAIHRYQTEDISLAKAASLAGVSWAQMKEILVTHGIQPRLGPETLEEARREVQALSDHFEAWP